MNTVLTVSGLNCYVRSLMDTDEHLRLVWLRGEISNLTDHYRSGHLYLTLKDEKAAVKAVMFAANARRLRFRPQDGMKVLVMGRVSLYEATGSYQFYIDDMQPDGVGALNLAYEQLKKRLTEEGLFDQSRKKPLPLYPRRIGVITSPTGAAVQDICQILKRRYPIGEIVLCPVLVQGEGAAVQLREALLTLNRLRAADVIIIGRGGGSLEDLWAFNDEALARTIAASEIPVVSAVGHETDFTICDFAADVRASTPSAGAELVAPEVSSMMAEVLFCRGRMKDAMIRRLDRERQRLTRLRSARVLRSPVETVHFRRLRTNLLQKRMQAAVKELLADEKRRFAAAAAKLDVMSPLKVLQRGYGIAEKEGKVLRTVKDASPGDTVTMMLCDGRLECVVTGRKENPP